MIEKRVLSVRLRRSKSYSAHNASVGLMAEARWAGIWLWAKSSGLQQWGLRNGESAGRFEGRTNRLYGEHELNLPDPHNQGIRPLLRQKRTGLFINTPAVIELGRALVGVVRHILGCIERSSVLQEYRTVTPSPE
jgi:hypothetical protein